MALTDKLSAIADAIRGKTGGTDPLTLDQMPTEIAGIQAGGGDGLPVSKFLDVDITVAESTTTAVIYTVDGVTIPTNVENPTKYASWAGDEIFIFVVKAVATEEATQEFVSIYESGVNICGNNTNYTPTLANVPSKNLRLSESQPYGFYGARVSVADVKDGVLTGTFRVSVRNTSGLDYGVLAGTYNIQGYLLSTGVV